MIGRCIDCKYARIKMDENTDDEGDYFGADLYCDHLDADLDYCTVTQKKRIEEEQVILEKLRSICTLKLSNGSYGFESIAKKVKNK